ncbi:ubiquitin-conjugating enzyme E2, putative [Leishmania guyanensis]
MTAPTAQCLKRLQIELRKLNAEEELPFRVGADPQNMLRCYFVVDGPADTPYEGGRYVGLIEIPSDYPFKPPSVQMCTPSGRLKTGMQICLSNSSYHPENWSPMWGLRTILIALVSFFASEEPTTGSMSATAEERRKYAASSRKYNVKRLHAVYKRVLPDAFAADAAFIEDDDISPQGEGSSSNSSGSEEEATETEEAPAGAKPEAAAQEGTTSRETAPVPTKKTPGNGKGEAADTVVATACAAAQKPRRHHQDKNTSGAVAQRGGQLQWRRYASLIVLFAIGLGLLRQLL